MCTSCTTFPIMHTTKLSKCVSLFTSTKRMRITTHQQDTQHCYSTAFHIYILAMSAILSSTCVCCCHPQQNSLSKDINMSYTPNTTHSTTFHKPPMHTTNTRYGRQNGTRCRKYCGVMHGWFLRFHPYMHLFSFRKLFVIFI